MTRRTLGVVLALAFATGPLSADTTAAVEKVKGSVVSLRALLGGPEQGVNVGAGVIVTADGYAVTVAHVVRAARSVEVTLADGTKVTATVEQVDGGRDLALLRLERTGLPAAQFALSAGLKQGEPVMAVGAPLGLEGSVTAGVVSMPSRQIEGKTYLQIDAAITSGSSGGPVINGEGHVVGLAVIVAKESDRMGFAVPSEDVVSFLQSNGVTAQMALGQELPAAAIVPPANVEAAPVAPARPQPGSLAPAPQPASGPGWLWVILLPIIISAIVSAVVTVLLAGQIRRGAPPIAAAPMPGRTVASPPARPQEDLSDVDIDLL